MTASPKRLLVSAGEVSGDRLAAVFVTRLRDSNPQLDVAGCGGSSSHAAGVDLWLDQKRINFVGWTGPARHIARLWLDQRKFLAHAERWQPDAVLLVDSPGWNRPVLQWANHRNLPVHWIAPPQLWAWKHRPAKYLKNVSVQPLFAFEIDELIARGAKVCWHGLPRTQVPMSSGSGPIALLPGTRKSLWQRHLPLFAQAVHALNLKAIVAVPATPDHQFDKICQRFGLTWELAPSLFSHASACIAVPGTGCLDAVRHAIPTVVAASPTPIDSWLAQRFLATGSKALPNRILSRVLVEECYGKAATPATILRLLESSLSRRNQFNDSLEELENRLGPPDQFPHQAWN